MTWGNDVMNVQRLLASGFACLIACTTIMTASAEEQTPKAVYLDYFKTFLSATDVNAVIPYMCKSVVKQMNETPADMKPMMFGVMKEMTPKEIEILSEKVDGDHATMTLSGKPNTTDPNMTEKNDGTVTMIREDGAWKIEKESWNSSIKSKNASPN
jgi:hypothetical protein